MLQMGGRPPQHRLGMTLLFAATALSAQHGLVPVAHPEALEVLEKLRAHPETAGRVGCPGYTVHLEDGQLLLSYADELRTEGPTPLYILNQRLGIMSLVMPWPVLCSRTHAQTLLMTCTVRRGSLSMLCVACSCLHHLLKAKGFNLCDA